MVEMMVHQGDDGASRLLLDEFDLQYPRRHQSMSRNSYCSLSISNLHHVLDYLHHVTKRRLTFVAQYHPASVVIQAKMKPKPIESANSPNRDHIVCFRVCQSLFSMSVVMCWRWRLIQSTNSWVEVGVKLICLTWTSWTYWIELVLE